MSLMRVTLDGTARELRTVWLEDGMVKLIDQRYLPFDLRIYEAKNAEDVAVAIEDMVVRRTGDRRDRRLRDGPSGPSRARSEDGRRSVPEDTADRTGPVRRDRLHDEGFRERNRLGRRRRSVRPGRHRPLPEDRETRGQAHPEWDADPHSLQRGGPCGSGLRDGHGADASRQGAGPSFLRLCR